MYIYKLSPRGFSEPVYKYIRGQTIEGLRKSARAAHILRRNWQPIRNALSGRNRDRPQHRDHYPTLCDKCVGSFKSLNSRIERLELRFNVLIRDPYQSFAKYGLLAQFLLSRKKLAQS